MDYYSNGEIMEHTKQFKSWMKGLIALMFIAFGSFFVGIFNLQVLWYVVMLPSTLMFVLITLGLTLSFISVDPPLENLKALNELHQMEAIEC